MVDWTPAAMLLLLSLTAPTPEAPGAVARARQAVQARHGAVADDAVPGLAGIDQAWRLWRAEDGDDEAFIEFVGSEFLPPGPLRDATFERFEFALERADGYLTSLRRDLRRGADLDLGPILPLDRRLAGWSPSAHVSEDLFGNRIAFVALLNFPVTTLEQRLRQGMDWSRRRWAETRLAQRFTTRIPGAVQQQVAGAYAAADAYINDYNIYMHHLLDGSGGRPFPAGLRLISHWGLRDELKARYSDPEGLPRQRLIMSVMERIVRQEIPAAVVNNPLLDWNPVTNEVTLSTVSDAEPPAGAETGPRTGREPDERYRQWLGIFHAEQLIDPHTPGAPSLIARRFDFDREIPEAEVRALFETVLTSALGARTGRLVEARLGRRLEPFDIWYAGFRPTAKYSEADLDALTRKRYPTAAAYGADMPRMLEALGFAPERARFLADRIVVEPSRGAGHAFGAARRDDSAHLRTRVGADGMDYKGYNIAVHEMGHNVEQVFSTTTIDHTLLQGVPNTAFTEALAFVFQGRDLELLGLEAPDEAGRAVGAVGTLWATREIAGVGLVDMEAWRWLYDHPEATPEEFRKAVVEIAQAVWNRYFAPIFHQRDVPLLAIYSHMVDSGMYTPDYPLGHLIAFQIEEHFRRRGRLGEEFERLCRLGALTPDAWMRQGVGSPLSAEPLLRAAQAALPALEKAK